MAAGTDSESAIQVGLVKFKAVGSVARSMTEESAAEEVVEEIPAVDLAAEEASPAEAGANGSGSEPESEAEQEGEPEPEPEPPTLEEQLAAAVERAEKAEAEIGYRDANLQNMARRSAQDRAELVRYAGFNLARRMLSVMGDVDRALDMIPTDSDETIGEGLQLLRNRLWQELKADGVTHIAAAGEQFDPNVHEALSTIPATDEHPSGVVVEVLEAGYRYKDRLLKPSRVIVAS